MTIITREIEGYPIPFNCPKSTIDYAEEHGASLRVARYTGTRFFVNTDQATRDMIDREWAVESSGK